MLIDYSKAGFAVKLQELDSVQIKAFCCDKLVGLKPLHVTVEGDRPKQTVVDLNGPLKLLLYARERFVVSNTKKPRQFNGWIHPCPTLRTLCCELDDTQF